MCQVSRSCNGLYQSLYPSEHVKLRAFLVLRRWIDEFFGPSDPSSGFFDALFIDKIMATNLTLISNQSQTANYIKFAGKILDHIAELSFPNIENLGAAAATLCSVLMSSLLRNFSNQRPIKLMHEMLNEVGFQQTFNLTLLSEMLHYGLKEWQTTSSKYNRYTRFGLRHLQLIESKGQLYVNSSKSEMFRRELGAVWDHIPSVHFIEDYLQCAALRNYGQIAYVPLRLIVDEAMRANITWSDGRLTLIEEHPKLFFDFNFIVSLAESHWNVNELKLLNLVTFFVRTKLMRWQEIKAALNGLYQLTPTQKFKFVRNYVSHLLGSDLRKQKASKYVNDF